MSVYWRLRSIGFTPAQAKALADGGYDVAFVPAVAVAL